MAPRVVLPDEEDDLTATELHNEVAIRLVNVLRTLFGSATLVLYDIFVRVNDTRQVAPDLTIVHGAARATRSSYRIPPEPVPDITVEVLSTVNDTAFGREKIESKRALLGTIGVPVHIEIDPDRGLVTTWRNVGGRLTPGPPATRYDGDDLGGLRIELSPGEVTFQLPDGRTYLDASTEFERAEHEAELRRTADQRAEREAELRRTADQRAEREAERAARLAEALRNAGIDPESLES